ncbi:hypothetical protein [uncultured Marivita sp.]|uniref:hypothetical protein n=1 Tax=uncultured Marivita sp. TaxID=888080 RepID=UPI00260CC7A5|nr:hypothetical protein [uncultured Marivita sp.]
MTFQESSLLFQNPDLTGLAMDETRAGSLPTRSPQFGFPLWGGEKTWIAPDSSWANGAPSAVLDSGAYEVTSKGSNHLKMVSPVCPNSQLSITRLVTINSGNEWTIDHSVTSYGSSSRWTGIWSVMMLDTPAKIAVEMDEPVMQPVFGDVDGMVAKGDGCVVADCKRQQQFKIGLSNPTGRTVIRCCKDTLWLECLVAKPQPSDRFAHQYPFEIFNSGDYDYCEAEWHSPARSLSPNETLQFRQVFRLSADKDATRSLRNEKEMI